MRISIEFRIYMRVNNTNNNITYAENCGIYRPNVAKLRNEQFTKGLRI